MLLGIAPPDVAAWQVALVVALVVPAAVVDLRAGKVPNWVTYPAILAGLVIHALLGGWVGDANAGSRVSWLGPAVFGYGNDMGLTGAAVGFAVGFFPLMVVWLAGGIGGGDAKLVGAIGAIGGWRLAVGAMMYGFVIAALMAVVVMVYKKVTLRTLRRVWHTVVLLVTPGAKPADPTSKDSPQIPFAVALCLGTVAAMISMFLRWPG